MGLCKGYNFSEITSHYNNVKSCHYVAFLCNFTKSCFRVYHRDSYIMNRREASTKTLEG